MTILFSIHKLGRTAYLGRSKLTVLEQFAHSSLRDLRWGVYGIGQNAQQPHGQSKVYASLQCACEAFRQTVWTVLTSI